MNKSKFFSGVFLVQLLIAVIMFVVGWYFYDKLPDLVPSHWNINGEIDAYLPKLTQIILFPCITLALAVLFQLISRIDPRKEKYVLFKKPWIVLQMSIVVFFAYLYFVTLYMAFYPLTPIIPFIFGGIGVLFVLLGNYLGKIKQNYFVGIKTPWTIDNEEVWNKTHRLGGWMFTVCGLIVFAEAFIQWQIVWVFIASVILTAIVPIVYSYLIFRKTKKQ
jgi:uncharacterized membrane protein